MRNVFFICAHIISLVLLVPLGHVANAAVSEQAQVAITARDAIRSVYAYHDHDVKGWVRGMSVLLAPTVSRDLLENFRSSGFADALDESRLRVRVVFSGAMSIRSEGKHFRQVSVPVQLLFEGLSSGVVYHKRDRWLNLVLHKSSRGHWRVVQFVSRQERCVNQRSAWINTQQLEVRK
jgi:hypothetical protein